MAKPLRVAALVLFWLAVIAALGLSVWLPAFIPAVAKAFIGHAVLSLAGIGGIGLWLANGYASAMRS